MFDESACLPVYNFYNFCGKNVVRTNTCQSMPSLSEVCAENTTLKYTLDKMPHKMSEPVLSEPVCGGGNAAQPTRGIRDILIDPETKTYVDVKIFPDGSAVGFVRGSASDSNIERGLRIPGFMKGRTFEVLTLGKDASGGDYRVVLFKPKAKQGTSAENYICRLEKNAPKKETPVKPNDIR